MHHGCCEQLAFLRRWESTGLSATDTTTGVTYSWSGPGSFSSPLQNPVINPATATMTGVYSVTATRAGCTSVVSTTTVTINPVPAVSSVTSAGPTTCLGTDGYFTLGGLLPGVSYTVTYLVNGSTMTTCRGRFKRFYYTVSGLPSATYSSIIVNSLGCVSNPVGPAILSDPGLPGVPVIKTNSPICVGQTLTFNATDSMANGSYSWIGPGEFTSTLQNPAIPDVQPAAAAGLCPARIPYTVSNCPNSDTIGVILYPQVHLTDIAPSQGLLSLTLGSTQCSGRRKLYVDAR